MTADDRNRDLLAARYLEALEGGDFATMDAIWQDAQSDMELADALQEVHAGLVEEQNAGAGRARRTAYPRNAPSLC